MKLVKQFVLIIGVGVFSASIFNIAFAQQSANAVLHMQSLQAEIADLRDMIERQDYRIRQLQRQVDQIAPQSATPKVGQQGVTFDASDKVISAPSVLTERLSQPSVVQRIPATQGLPESQQLPTVEGYIPENREEIIQQSAGIAIVDERIIQAPSNNTKLNDAYPPIDERVVGLPKVTSDSLQSQVETGSLEAVVQAAPQISPANIEREPLRGSVIPLPEAVNNVPVQSGEFNNAIDASEMLMPAGAATKKESDKLVEETYYQEGFDLLKASKHDDAVSKFKKQIETYPNGDLADDANYWIAESMYVNRRLNVSKEYFKVIIERYKESSRLPDAMLKTAYIEQEQGNKIEARILLQEIIQFHPSSNAAISAKNRLVQLK